jgi:ribosomal protein S18 acetylase RimI-like enzyme
LQPAELGEGGPSAELPEGSEERTAVAVASPEELTGHPLADLHALAREHGVPRYRLLRKPELVEALGGAPAPGPTAVGEPAPRAPVLRIEEVKDASVDVLDALQRLVGELSSTAAKPRAAELEEIIESPVTRLIVARNERNEVVGMLTLVLFRIPTGMRAWIEDVVVDQRQRGEGIGKRLVREAIRIAGENRARTIDLTSNRSREAANRMYRDLGFSRRDTTVYRIDSGS